MSPTRKKNMQDKAVRALFRMLGDIWASEFPDDHEKEGDVLGLLVVGYLYGLGYPMQDILDFVTGEYFEGKVVPTIMNQDEDPELIAIALQELDDKFEKFNAERKDSVSL